jgi:outer membrane cobalamin receptor
VVRPCLLALALTVGLSWPAHAQDAGAEEHDAGGADSGAEAADAMDAALIFEAPEEPIAPPPTTSHDVVVTAPRPLLRDSTQSATVIQGDTIRASTRTTVFDVLSQESADVYVPGRGVGLHGVANAATGGIRIRGLGGSPNSQILVVEDGVPDYQGIFGHPIPDAYVSHLIEDVLVIKGGDSTLYGTNAMGGAVIIRNRWPVRDGMELQTDTGYGSYATMRQSVSLLAHAGDWDTSAAFSAMKTDGHRPGAGGNSMVGSVAVRYRISPDLRLTLRNKVAHILGADPGSVSSPTPNNWFDVWRDTLSAQLAYAAGRARLSLTPYLNLGVHRLYDNFYSRDYVGGAIGEVELRLHPMATLLLGAAAEGIDGLVENRDTGERPEVSGLANLSAYGQVTVRPLSRLSVVLGSRALTSTKYGFVPLYKAGAHWDIGHGFSVHGRISRNFRQPTMRELYLPYPTANPDLQPEYAVNTDGGVGYASEHFEISGSIYKTSVRNLIKYFGSWPTAEVINIDHFEVHGVEGRVSVKGLGPLSASIAGDWQDVGRYTRQNPNAKVNFMIESAHEFGPHALRGSLNGEWVNGLYMSNYSRDPIADVFFMDLAFRYRFQRVAQGQTSTSFEPYLLLRNFLDRRYAYVDKYTMPGFNVLAGLKIGI